MKKISKFIVVFWTCIMILSLCSCGGNDSVTMQDQTYTIQYTDNTGVHSIEVEAGKLYSISSVPEQNGYEFMGLYDAEVGGTQYVNAGGSAVAAFTDNKNIVLYPQFKAKEYTLVLDYQGAAVTGSRSLTVGYNSLIDDLPMNLTMENKNFVGWYTQPDKQGKQVADQYGAIPSKNIVDESIFDLSDPKGYIYLYAGFKGEEFIVTFYLTENGAPEEVKVEYGTPISDVQLETRVDGNAVIAWSKKRNDINKEEVFNGKVTSEMVLYAAEFAPVIDFDSNGGNSINSVISRTGEAIKLPTPIRENYKFMGWQDGGGNVVNYSTMPENSIKLNAKWQAMIIFDTNGGTEVQSISEPQGTKITLPVTEKAGYMFAGWYDEEGEKYEYTSMPTISVKLLAKYWSVKKKTIVIIEDSRYKESSDSNNYLSFERGDTIDLSDIYSLGVRTVRASVNYNCYYRHEARWSGYACINWYYEKTISDVYLVWNYSDKVTDENTHCSHITTIELKSPKLYGVYYKSGTNNYSCYRFSNFYVEIEYPDMSTLY